MVEKTDTQVGSGFALGAQYIKDLSFENKLSLDTLQAPSKKPQTDIQFHVSKNQLAPDQHEVCLRVVATLKIDEKNIYLFDMTYAGLFMLKGVEANVAEQVLMIECPRLLYPSARALVVTLTQESGFPPLYLAPAINFASLYGQQKKKQDITH